MRLTVLGKSPSWQDAGGACSGYLLEDGDTCVLVDCGNGVFSKLRRFRDYTTVDAVVVSHLHADHVLDLIPFASALTYAPRQQPVPVDRWPGTDRPARPRLIAPPGATAVFRQVCAAVIFEDLIERAFAIEEYDASVTPRVGSIELAFRAVPHFTETFAIAARSSDGGGRIAYGADCRPSEEIVDFARGADLLLLEATLPRPERDGVRGHLTPAEAGDHARRAGARRLVLTHISDELDELWAREQARRLVLTHISDELDELWAREQAAAAFGGPVEVAREGAVYEV